MFADRRLAARQILRPGIVGAFLVPQVSSSVALVVIGGVWLALSYTSAKGSRKVMRPGQRVARSRSWASSIRGIGVRRSTSSSTRSASTPEASAS